MRLFVALLMVLSLVVPSFSQVNEPYYFRYKGSPIGYFPSNPGEGIPSDPDLYDVTARFFGMLGVEFESEVPTKPGAAVVSWRIDRGVLPSGLSFDPQRGAITGTPNETVKKRELVVVGIPPQGERETRALVQIDVEPHKNHAVRQEAYGHTGKPFHAALSAPSGAVVYNWTSLVDLPDWATIVNGHIKGTPPAEGSWPLSVSGTDYSGREVAYAFGQIVVEDGPRVEFIADQYRHRSDDFGVTGRVERKLGVLRWEIEGDPRPAALSFTPASGRIEGRIAAYDASYRFRLKAIDIDGTYGYSNYFTFNTLPAELSLNSVPDQHLVRNKPTELRFHSQESVGEQAWAVISGELPSGLSIDPSTGVISGTPTTVGEWSGIVIRMEDAVGETTSNAFAINVHNEDFVASVGGVNARVGVAFEGAAPAVSGGDAPYAFALAQGAELPTGVSLNEETGALSGTLVEPGPQSAELVPIDANGRVGKPFVYGLTGYGPLSISVADSYSGERLTALNVSPVIAEYSAMPPVSWALSPNTPPAGMTFSSTTGALSGTPTAIGIYGPYTVTVTDASETATSQPFTVEILDVPPLQVVAGTVEIERMVSSQTRGAAVENAIGDVEWTLDENSSALPEGLRFDRDGYFRGAVSAINPVTNVVVRATDSEGRTAVSEPFTLQFVQPQAMRMEPIVHTWPVNVPFSVAMAPENPAGNWTATASGLPGWIGLNASSGALSGTASQVGQFGPFAINVSDELGRTATANFTLVVTEPLALEIADRIDLHRLQETAIRPEVVNAVGSVTWAKTGTIPVGMTFDDSSGYVSGVPTSEGSYTFGFTARDEAGQIASVSVMVVVGPRLPVDLAYELPTLYVGKSTGLPLAPRSPMNAAPPVAFTLTGALPQGISFNPATGVFSGIPTKEGTYAGITVNVSDGEGQTASANLTFRVEPDGAMSVSSPVTRKMRLGEYTEAAAPEVRNGVRPFTFSTVSGAPLSDPDGLVLIEESGVIAGVVTTPTSRSHQIRVTDAMGRSATYAVVISPVGELEVVMANVSGNRAKSLSVSAQVENAVGNVSYSLSPSTLPDGLTFSGGRISGVPTVEGAFGPFLLAVSDSTGATANASFSIQIDPKLPLTANYGASTFQALANSYFRLTPLVENATGPLSWEVVSGTMPTGLQLHPTDGRIYGTPTELGVFSNIVLRVTDTSGATHQLDPISFEVVLNGKPIKLNAVRHVAKIGMTFTTQVPTYSNHIGDVEFRSPDAEMLGLSVDIATGIISGTVSQPGVYSIDLNITDSTNRVTSEPLVLEVLPKMVATAREIYATVNQTMNSTRPVTVNFSHGTVSYVLHGALPAGLTFSAAGFLSGKPTALGLYENLVVVATDALGDVVTSAPFSIEVLDNGLIPTITSMPAIAVLKVGTAMAARTPSVSYKKTGDVYTINKPLPDGLVLDPVTGTISGTPAVGSHGIHTGYVISVADTLGRGTSSTEFDIKIRHQDSVTMTLVSQWPFRVNVPFETPAPVINNAHALIGDPVFSINYAGFSVDPDTGVMFGLNNTSRTVILTLSDDVGVVTTRSVEFKFGNLQISLGAQTYGAGTSVDYQPTVSLATPEAVFAWEPQVAGVMPSGLSMDPSTGRITGTMPFGTYFIRASVTDYGETKTTGYMKWVGTSNAPLNLSPEPRTDVENGALIESEILPITGLASSVNGVLSGWGAEYRTCYDAECKHVRASWTTLTGLTNGEFIQFRTGAPLGGNQTVVIAIKAGNVEAGTWTLTTAPAAYPSASGKMPFGGQTSVSDDIVRKLYDGKNEAAVTVSSSNSLLLDFGEVVSFDSFYMYQTEAWSYSVDVYSNGSWGSVYQGSASGQISLSSPSASRLIRIRNAGTHVSQANFIREFRIGDGGQHNHPTLAADEFFLTGSSQTVQLRAEPYLSSYAPDNSLTFAIVSSGGLDVSVTPTGQLTLPSTAAGNWRFKIRVTDDLGYATETVYDAFSVSGVPASSLLPSSATGVNVNAAKLPELYDGITASWVVSIGAGKEIVYDFGQFVDMSGATVGQTGTVRDYELYVEVGDEWKLVAGPTKSADPAFERVYPARKIRLLSKTTWYDTLDLSEFAVH